MSFLMLTPRDPVIARDGRPFGAGQGRRMRSLDWPYPSVLAGSLRTLLGKMAGGDFKPAMIEDLKAISLAGPFPRVDRELYLPRPLDVVVREAGGTRECFAARPSPLGSDGCDFACRFTAGSAAGQAW